MGDYEWEDTKMVVMDANKDDLVMPIALSMWYSCWAAGCQWDELTATKAECRDDLRRRRSWRLYIRYDIGDPALCVHFPTMTLAV